jgi:TonB family protein
VVTTEIERRKGAIVAAYERALRRDPSLAGRVEVAFTIDARGRASDVAVTVDSLGAPEVAHRILTLLPTWRFPASRGGAQRYAYPFLFRPVGAARQVRSAARPAT